jgi:hypothetical protein
MSNLFDAPAAKKAIDDFLGNQHPNPEPVKHQSGGTVTVKELDELAEYIFAKRNRSH